MFMFKCPHQFFTTYSNIRHASHGWILRTLYGSEAAVDCTLVIFYSARIGEMVDYVNK